MKPTWLRSALCIMLTSFGVLMLQITIIRILSVVLWYHWAFLSISLAMLGVGVPGVWFALRPPRPEIGEKLLNLAGLLVPLSVVAIIQLTHHFGDYKPLFCVACILPPMLALGAVVCLLLLEARGAEVSRIYGFDLLGACLGAMLVIPAMHLVPTPSLAVGIGFVALAASAVRRGRASKWVLLCAAAVAGLLVWGEPLTIRHNKIYDEHHLEVLHERWTPTARLTFFDKIHWLREDRQSHAWGRGRQAPVMQVDQIWMDQDGCAGTPLTAFDGDIPSVDFLLYDVTALGYQLVGPRRVAVIGAGGGRDILAALAAGAEQVDAIEINGGTVDAVSTVFKDFTGDVYHLPGVQPIVSEGRSYLRRSSGNYDLIQISLIDSWSATAAGAFALSENNLYTLEAFRLYLSRLSEHGVIATSRWLRGNLGFEIPRLLALAKAALRDAGVDDPGAHLVVAAADAVGTVILSKQPITDEQRTRLVEVAELRGFEVLHPEVVVRLRPRHKLTLKKGALRGRLGRSGRPKMNMADVLGGPTSASPTDGSGVARPAAAELVRQVVADERAAARQAGFDLAVPTDDRPFFFHVLPVFEPVDSAAADRFGINGTAIFVLQLLMAAMTALTVVLFFLPFALTRWLRREQGFWRGSGYFASIGVGFMLIEVPWLQRFILLLEHPSHATTIVLACLLLGAGLGSLGSTRLGVARLQRYGFAVPLLLALANLLLPVAFETFLSWSFPARAFIAAVLLVPLGVPLGMFFPLGMQRFGDDNKAWFWAVNGAFSVLASVLSLALALQLGFANVTWIGVVAYLLAWLLLGGSATESESASVEAPAVEAAPGSSGASAAEAT